MATLYRRLAAGVGGQAFARLTVIVNALGTIPILLHYWGVETYGEWLTLTSIASYLTLSTFGLSSAFCMEMIKAASKNAFPEATQAFQVGLNILITVILPMGVALTLLLLALPLRDTLRFTVITQAEILEIILLLFIQIVAATAKGLFAGAINASGHYGAPNYISGVLRIIELSAIAASVIFWQAMPISVALISTFVGGLDLAMHAGVAMYVSPWARIRFGVFNFVLVRRLVGPSVGHSLIYIAVNSVVVQGPRIALSAIIGPAAVSVFSVFSTLARSIDHITALVTSVLQLEFARNSGAKDGAAESRRMVIFGSHFAIGNYLILSIIIFLAGPFVIPAWTSYKISFDGELLGVILVGSFFTQLGRSAQSYLLGHNEVQRAALIMLFLGSCGLGIGAILTPYLNVTGMAVGLFISEALTTSFLILLVAQHLKTPTVPFFLDQLDLIAAGKKAIHFSKTFKLAMRNSDHDPR